MRFSERYGYKPVRENFQIDTMSDELKNRLWSLIYANFFKLYIEEKQDVGKYSDVIDDLWSNHFKISIDELATHTSIGYKRKDNVKKIKTHIFKNEWFAIYDLLEFILQHKSTTKVRTNKFILSSNFIDKINTVLKDEKSAYILINKQFVQITSEQEIQCIEEALENSNPFSGVQQHLNQALTLMSDRQNPDYRNSIKESISAVESICKTVTKDDKATLGKALKIIEDQFGLHPALKGSLSQLYGYTSDSDGIRHAMLEESNLTYIDAKFMLVACTNFINYLIEKTKD